MTPIVRSFAVAASALIMAVPAFATLTPQQRAEHHDRTTIRFFLHHPKLANTPQGIAALLRVLAHQQTQLRSLQAVHDARAALPAHDSLWSCLMRYEGGYPSNQNTGGNGHWGGLQMHPDWGYGTSYHASDDPWIVQESAAERGYAASGYSQSFLYQQWGETIGNCIQYA